MSTAAISIPIPEGAIERKILMARGRKVLLSIHLAELYEVPAKTLLQAVKRNIDRFPADFMFQLTAEEWTSLRSQIVTLEGRGRHPKYRPYAFTEQGVAMLSSVLRSDRAVEVNIAIMRTFVRLRRLLAEHDELATRLGELEQKCDEQFQVVFDAIRRLIEPPENPRRPIGFL